MKAQTGEPRDVLRIRLDPDLKDAIERAATEREVSVNWLVSFAMKDFVKRLLPVDEMRITRD